ncbi:MAG: hypothetical protein IKG44_08495 [Mogibacterium sp.]|nr:hypothetical protein [Mogibacterium sp.]
MREHIKRRNSIFVLMTLVLIITMTACEKKEQSTEEVNGAENPSAELSQNDLDALLQQVADNEVQKDYEKYMPDKAFANAEVFGIDRDGDSGKAYVYLNYSEYVALKGKAYEMSGGSGEAIIKFNYSESGPELNEVEWSADGDLHDGWLKDNFPAEYLKKAKAFEAYDEKGRNVLTMMLQDTVEKAMGVPVEQNDLLSIDTDKETYEIVKVIESGEGENYKFDTETLEKGNLSDL